MPDLGLQLSVTRPAFVSVFMPTDIAGLQLWLDASRIGGAADGDVITTWADQSGNGNDAIQSTADSKPTYQSDSGSRINGRPVVRFDGTDDCLTLTAPLTEASVTVYAVGRRAAASKWIPAGGGALGAMAAIYSDNNAYLIDDTGAFPSVAYTGAVGAVAARWRYANGGTPTFAASGQASGNLSGAIAGNFEMTDVGCRTAQTEFAAGDYAEILIFDTALSAGNMATVEAYLASKWGVTI